MGGIVAYLIFAVPVFFGSFDNMSPAAISKLISNYQFTCQYLIYLFTQLYNTLNDLSSVAGNSKRIGELITSLQVDSSTSTDSTIVPNVNPPEDVCLELHNLTIKTPDQKTLIKEVNFQMKRGMHVLITGRSGCGKTSLFRCVNKLWSSYQGQIVLNSNLRKVFFLPQTSYFANGSLLQQVIYPSNQCIDQTDLLNTTSNISAWLKVFNLEHLLEKVNFDINSQTGLNWTNILSAG
jgi:ATP-binding cassette subfamily D (ALD) protein 4